MSKFNQNSLRVLEQRYLKKDETGKPTETPEDLFKRVATAVANPSKDCQSKAILFYDMMINGEFLPNSPCLMNAGREMGQLSACFVLPVDDSMESIFDAIKNAALVHKTGGGTGFSFSRLRPKNDFVQSTSGVSSGPVSFMSVFNAATEQVKQGGKRRGANIGVLRVDHPDIMEFIHCKDTEGAYANFNISVALTDEFMNAVKNNTNYNLVNPKNKQTKSISAKEVFDSIVDHTWKNGEPGVLFIDTINKHNPIPGTPIESTNPCGEIPLEPFGSCNLGSINMVKMLKMDDLDNEHPYSIDWEKFKTTIENAVEFLDNVVTINKFPLPQIEETTLKSRKIGLGLMGWADMLVKLGIQYDSTEHLNLIDEVMNNLDIISSEKSCELAKERGAFPDFDKSIYADKEIRRNATLTTLAPTGTISIITGCSSGIEPHFALRFTRENVLDGTPMYEYNKDLELALEGVAFSEADRDTFKKTGSIQHIASIDESIKKRFRTAMDISPDWHLQVQARFQHYIHNSISKTINCPKSSTAADVSQLYMRAWELQCKGLTIYRNDSREKQVLTLDRNSKVPHMHPAIIRNRPSVTEGKTFKISTGCGNMYVTINEDADGPIELFAQVGKSGACASCLIDATTRSISMALRANVPIEYIQSQLQGFRCPTPAFNKTGPVLSCIDGISQILDSYVYKNDQVKPVSDMGFCPDCPECQEKMVVDSGCAHCPKCGFSKCG